MTEDTQKGNCCASTTFTGNCTSSCIGKNPKEVEGEWRIVSQDGIPFAVTMDFRPNRKNLTVVNGIVTACTMG